MKTILITSFILFLKVCSFAQFNSSLASYVVNNSTPSGSWLIPPSAVRQVEVLPPGYRMKNVGSTLMLAGSFLVIGGVILASNSDDTINSNYNSVPTVNPQEVLASYMIGGGVGMIVPGIIFWAKGARKYKRFLAEEDNHNVSLRFTGNGVVYRF
ncbi:MAG: hypothetical protein DI538_08165 [Azospira oryzae]|nr:hypothetical protein [Cytophaga sp.]PZR38973.1 MAG: hypothetical protein DI538_08165 [Azospira oryzae]